MGFGGLGGLVQESIELRAFVMCLGRSTSMFDDPPNMDCHLHCCCFKADPCDERPAEAWRADQGRVS